ncbi:PIN domain-containing protein [Candidatus Gottesmanbacteria bacterium]|nr:PIN domain-containing protein [Candidatus Gottesmanbacteria bacterium]
MKSSVIADTSALISLVSLSDGNHTEATNISNLIKKHDYPLIIPGEVFTETINTLGKKAGHRKAMDTARALLGSKELVIFDTSPDLRKNALVKFHEQPESVSFTDCLVMACADEYKTKLIFGFDSDFRKNGYTRFGLDDQK